MVDLRTNTEHVLARAMGLLDRTLDYPVNLVGALVSLPERGVAGLRQELLKPLMLRDLRRRLIVTTTDEDREAQERAVILSDILEFLETRDWTALASYIHHVDRTRNATPSGVRHLDIATFELRRHLANRSAPPDVNNYEISFDYSDDILDALSTALEHDPDNAALAAILARIHLDCGWSARGSGWAEMVGEEGWAAMNAHYDTARDIITRFDPVAYDSPFLAEIQYRLCVGLENGRDRLTSAFIDWIDLDPGNLTAYRQHAYHCLPRWFGDYKILEEQAQLAARHTKDTLRDGAYTAMMLHALRFEDGAALYLKPDLLLAGLDDIAAFYDSDPLRLTALLSELVDALQPHYHHLLGAKRAKKRIAKAVRAGLADVLRTHLSLFCTRAWSQSEEDYLVLVSCAFKPELARGATIVIGPEGHHVVSKELEAVQLAGLQRDQ
ncbi:MAG: hypothetical protein AAGA12_11175 [Pseudomonadota bacterium]